MNIRRSYAHLHQVYDWGEEETVQFLNGNKKMETITINTANAHNLKNRYHKFLKVCSLFNSRMEFEADKHLYDARSDSDLIRSFDQKKKLALHISGNDERQAAHLIKQCINY